MRRRRKYVKGRGGDCGWTRRVTEIIFWVNGHRMYVCAQCIAAYRDRILAPPATGTYPAERRT